MEYEKEVKGDFKEIAIDGWTNRLKLKGKSKKLQMSLLSAYLLFTGLTGKKNAKKFDSEDELFRRLLKSYELNNMDFKEGIDLDTQVTEKKGKN